MVNGTFRYVRHERWIHRYLRAKDSSNWIFIDIIGLIILSHFRERDECLRFLKIDFDFGIFGNISIERKKKI